MSSFGSTTVTGTLSANWRMAASITSELSLQPALPQQLWNSSRRRTTRRDWVGSSRLIFGLMALNAASAAASMSAGNAELVVSAKNGCCGVAAPELWHRTQFAVAALRTSAYSCEFLKVTPLGGLPGPAASSIAVAGKPLEPPTSLIVGACSWMVVPPAAFAPAQFLIQTVSVSAQAEGEASQQLWPPPTLMTMRD